MKLDIKTKGPNAREFVEDVLSYCQLRILEKHRVLYALEGLPEFFSKNFQKQKKNKSYFQEENDYFDEESIQEAQKIQDSIQKEIDKNYNVTVSHKYFPFQEKFPLFRDEPPNPESILLKLLNQYYQKHPKPNLKSKESQEDAEQSSAIINRSKASKSSLKLKPSPRNQLKVSFMDQLQIDSKKNLKIFTYYPEEESNFPPPPQENRLIPISEDDLRSLGIVFRKLEIEEEFIRKGSAAKKTILYSQQIMEKLQKDLEKDRQDIEQQENTQKYNAMLRKQEKKEKKKEKKQAVKKEQETTNQKKENNLLERYQSQKSGSPLSLFMNQYDYYTRQLVDEQILKEIEKLQEQKEKEQIEEERHKKIQIPKINLEQVIKSQDSSPKREKEIEDKTQNGSNNLRTLNSNISKALALLPPGIMKPPIIPVPVNANQAQHQDDQSDALESSHSFNELFSSRENTYRMQKK